MYHVISSNCSLFKVKDKQTQTSRKHTVKRDVELCSVRNLKDIYTYIMHTSNGRKTLSSRYIENFFRFFFIFVT